MPPPGLQIYLRSRVTLTSDLLTPKSKVDGFMPLPVDLLCQFALNRFIHFQNIVLTSLVIDERTDSRALCFRLPVWPGGGIINTVFGTILLHVRAGEAIL